MDSGTEATKPIRPPACRMAISPSDGAGVPLAMCSSPSTPMVSALFGGVGEPFSQTFTVSGGVAPYTWSAGALPPGLTEGAQLPEPVFTPTTKAAEGHDEPLSYDETVAEVVFDD